MHGRRQVAACRVSFDILIALLAIANQPARRRWPQSKPAALNQINWKVSVPDDTVKVQVEKGHVTRTGTVDHYFQKDAARWDVWPLPGVLGVTNLIAVKPRPKSLTIGDRRRTWPIGSRCTNASGRSVPAESASLDRPNVRPDCLWHNRASFGPRLHA